MPTAKPARHPGAGDIVATLASGAGYSKLVGCGCNAMRQKMNRWGWAECWRRRDEIVGWLVGQAKKHNAPLSSPDLAGLVAALLLALASRKWAALHTP